MLVNGETDCRGVLAQALSVAKAKRSCIESMSFHVARVMSIYIDVFNDRGFISLKWLNIAKMQKACLQCQELVDVESLFVQKVQDGKNLT